MHRQSPIQQGYVGYTGGGARALVNEVSDNPQMQEMSGSFLNGENRQEIESPQNYGFTSVVRPATKDRDGNVDECAEAYLSFLGGNRSFPVATVMDDRRYRLKNLQPGDVAMFDHMQHQLHLNKDGVFITGRTDTKIKFQLADPPQQQQGGGGGSSSREGVEALAGTDSSSGGGSSSSGSSGGKNRGQKQRYETSGKQYLEMTKSNTNLVHDQSINYKTASHTFTPPDGAALHSDGTPRAGGPLVSIMGDKLTKGFGEFIKQVKAADPTMPQHLTTKKYIDTALKSIWQFLSIPNPPIQPDHPPGTPPPPMPPQPPPLVVPGWPPPEGRAADGSITINGDFTVTGNLIVNGVVRAKGFEKI